MTHSFQRARNPEHKQQRANDLLDAARRLALADGVHAVTLTEIAAQAGVHLSGVRRYFASREEIYLQLAAEGWDDWAACVAAGIAAVEGVVTPAQLAEVFAQTLAEYPLFCDLLAHVPVSLERGARPDSVSAFKVSALDAVDRIIDAVRASGALTESLGIIDLVAVATSLAGSLWQTAHPAATLQQVYAEDPRLAHSAVDFLPRLERLLRVTARGLAAEERPSGPSRPHPRLDPRAAHE